MQLPFVKKHFEQKSRMDITASATNSIDGLASQVLGQMEIIGNIRVRKLKKRKVVTAPPVGKPFGLNVQCLPQLGIGVNTVQVSSPLFNYIRRGDIVTEFMGIKLHDTTTDDFVNMVRQQVSEGTERKLVVEYTAAYLTQLWEEVETTESEEVQESEESEAMKSVTNSTPPDNKSNKADEEVQNCHDISSKEISQSITKKNIFPEEKDSITENQKPAEGEKSSCKIGPSSSLSKSNDTNNQILSKEKTTAENSDPKISKDPTISIATNQAEANKLDTNTTQESDFILDEERLTMNSEDFEGWLAKKKETWKFGERIKKASQNDSNSDIENDKKAKFEPATLFGLPDGWMVRIKSRSRYTFRCPNGKLFYSKKKVCEYLCISSDELFNSAVAAPATKCEENIRTSSDGPEFTKVYEPAKKGEKKLLKDTTSVSMEAQKPSTPKPHDVSNEVISKNIPTLAPVGNDASKEDSHPKEAEAKFVEERPSENSNSSVDSLFDIITNLNNARKTVAEFGPLPWKGCKIVKGPPAPTSFGISVQTTPGKLGIGIVKVEEKSILTGHVKRGDIITHFNGTPVHGLSCKEVVRLLQSEVQNDRFLHIVPSGFNLSLLHKNTQETSQTCTANPVMREPDQNVANNRIVPVNVPEKTVNARPSPKTNGNTSNENKSYPRGEELNVSIRDEENHRTVHKQIIPAGVFDDDKKSLHDEKDQSSKDKSTSMNFNNESQHSKAKNTTIPLPDTLGNTSTTLTQRNFSLNPSCGNQLRPSMIDAEDSNVDAQLSSGMERKVQNEEDLDTSTVIKYESQDETEVFHNNNITHGAHTVLGCSERPSTTCTLANQRESVTNNVVDTNFLSNNGSVSATPSTGIKLEDVNDELSYQTSRVITETRSTERVENDSNSFTERIENHDNNSSPMIGSVGTMSAIEEHSGDIQRSENPWSLEEDNLLRRLVSEHGENAWGRISLELPRRTSTACRFRWIDDLNPSILLRGNQACTNIRANNREDADEEKSSGQSSGHNTNDYKKVILPPYDGPLGMNVQELPSKKGIGVVRVKETSPLFGKLHRGDVIVQFMEVSLRDITVLDFIEMVKERENETRYFLISTQRSMSNPSQQSRSVFGIPVIDLNDEGIDVREKISTHRATGMNLGAFLKEDVDKMPVCFAFNPCNMESQRIAERKQKLWNENFEMRKKQKTHP